MFGGFYNPKIDRKMTKQDDKKNGTYVKIFGVQISITHKEKALRQVQEFVSKKKKFSIVTPNPEIVLKAVEDASYRAILNQADIAIPDGIGLVWASKLIDGTELTLIKGRDLFLDLCKLANKKGWRIYLLGGEYDEALRAKQQLESTLKRIKIRANSGPILNEFGDPVDKENQSVESNILREILDFRPQLLFIAFSAPKQERWMMRHLADLPVGGAMVIGGALNYTSGRSSLPPDWLAKWGLEWLWRGLTEPWRFKRIINAAIVFPWKVFLYKLKEQH